MHALEQGKLSYPMLSARDNHSKQRLTKLISNHNAWSKRLADSSVFTSVLDLQTNGLTAQITTTGPQISHSHSRFSSSLVGPCFFQPSKTTHELHLMLEKVLAKFEKILPGIENLSASVINTCQRVSTETG